MRIILITGSVLVFAALKVFAQPTSVDLHINMDFRSGLLGVIRADRPYWIEVTRTHSSTDGWLLQTYPDSFGQVQFAQGTTLGFYDDLGTLLFTNRQASGNYHGSFIGFGTAYSPGFGVGSPDLPALNRPYYIGVAGADWTFLPNFAITVGSDTGAFEGRILPAPSALTVLMAISLPLATRRRRN